MIPTKKQGGVITDRRQAVQEAPASRVVPKPVPQDQTQDVRGYQLNQLRRRYSPKETACDDGTTSLSFRLVPSDPDFPYDLDYLQCEVYVPAEYPREPPTLNVRNSNMPRGFALNIEKGWTKLVQGGRGATLLALTYALDKNLESFLSEQKAETVKLMSFKDDRHLTSLANVPPAAVPVQKATETGDRKPYVPEPSYSKEQIAEAKARRAQETRQIETRMGRLPVYHKSSDGIVYTLSIEPKRRTELPTGLQAVKSFQLIVPLLYPLQTLRVLLNDVESQDAEAVEEFFTQRAAEQKQMTLMSHMNYLTQNMHSLAKQARARSKAEMPVEPHDEQTPSSGGESPGKVPAAGGRPHIQVIPRPPEWSDPHDDDDSSASSEDYTDYSDDAEDGGVALESEPAEAPPAPTQVQEHGIAITFPSVELHGIELLQVSILNISVKCERCKTVNDVEGLRDNAEKIGSCKKCASTFAIRYRRELVHQHSTRAGFLDITGAAVADILSSTFIPTCGKCSTDSQGLVSVRGETTTNVCRECHSRFTFKIPDLRFLAYAPGSTPSLPITRPKRRIEKLGLRAGEPLPNRGACAHYRRSYRWFRFSCCGKVHPCDRCHDEAEGHDNEWASRMVCGWCSREQRYAVESCTFCGRSVIGKRGTGYWEGGKGTRNQVLMRRGDKRKYRHIGSGGAKKQD